MTFAAKMLNAAKLLMSITFAARIPEAADQGDGAAEEVFAGLRWGGIHQLEFESEGVGFAAAFGGGVVFACHHVTRTAEEVGVVGSCWRF